MHCGLREYGLSPKRSKHRDARLYRAALKYFGSWNDALEAAGINWRNVRMDAKPQRHDKQKILEMIRERHISGLTLVWSEVCCENRTLAQAAKQLFGSWSRALVAAGIGSKGQRVGRGRKWNAQKVIAQIQKRHRQDKSLVRKVVYKDDPSLVHAAWRYFGQWHAAIEAAGIVSEDCNRTEKKE